MGRINMGRVLVGGLVAGLLINISEFILNGLLLADDMNAAMAALNRAPVDNRMIVWFVVLGFGVGFMAVWLYAAIRPRFGPGIRTAVCASMTVWGLAFFYPNLIMIIMSLFPTRLVLITTAWGLVELIIAGIMGAWVYTEADTGVLRP